jgi:ATP-dependent DNA helicase RecG
MTGYESVEVIKGVGSSVSGKFAKLKINTVLDLVEYVPKRFDDYSKVIRISQIRPGPVSLKAKIHSVKSRYSKKGLHMTEATASDNSSSVKLVWFNQPYRANSIKHDEEYFIAGEFGSNYKYFAITNPAVELVSSFPVNTARLVPQYKLTKGLGATQIRKAVKNALDIFKPHETLPKWILKEEELINKSDALLQMHFPGSIEELKKAKKRLAFEEIFKLTLASELNKEAYKKEHGLKINFNQKLIKQFVNSLDFKLTDDQRKVAWTIFKDMDSGRPMNRLVEGDVGSGKTVVAVLAAIGVMDAGFQVAFMAPTELLAKQHADSIHNLLKTVGFHEEIMLLTGSMSSKQKDVAYNNVKLGKAKLIIGTHAIFQDKVDFNNLGLIIVDEQHRFGVGQRKKLQSKANEMPHVLNMTATPIPRSLALTLYGEMDVSIIAQMPEGRKPVKTTLTISENREKVYQKIRAELDDGRQAFVVCPQIEEDEAGKLSVKKIHDELSKKLLKDYRLGLLHGQMKANEKDEIMQKFIVKEIDVLVSTTVIEVGVNVPNASVMIIEGADKFGLAQIHQLRGRVGRGSDKAYCYLITSDNNEPTKRLKILENENNGFKLAEYDLEIRGPGAIYGTMQHGELDLRVANLTDVDLIRDAREAAKRFIRNQDDLVKYPELNSQVKKLRTITNLN